MKKNTCDTQKGVALMGGSRMKLGKLFASMLVAGTAFAGLAVGAQAGEFDGVTVNILTRPGPVIAQPLKDRGVDFEKMTGAKIVVTEVPFAEIFPKIQNDWTTGTNSIDVGVFAAGWGVELDAAGLLEDLDPYIAKDTKLGMDDIAPYFREFGQKVGGKTKMLMVDGDFQMVYYRKDVLEKAGLQPPKTWEDYIAVAKAIHGQDMNGDGVADYGSCIFKKRNAQSYFAIQTVAAPIIQTMGTAQGFHFDNATMKPIFSNDGWKKAFELYKETGKYGPAEELNMDIGDTRGLFKAGRCGLLIEWGDPGTLQLDKDAEKVKGMIFAVGAVGSKEVLDRATGKLVAVTKENSPYSVDGINYAPFAAFGGWAGAINAKADQKKKDAAYAFLSYMNQAAQSNVDVTIGATGYNPYRLSQLSSTDLWVKAGMPADLATNYLGAINGALNNPNMASDMKIPGAQQYTSVVIDTELARYLAGEITVDEALKNIDAGFEKITEDFGRDSQIKAQALALGLK
jgi:multiple sugar transport system substrate-binding protein